MISTVIVKQYGENANMIPLMNELILTHIVKIDPEIIRKENLEIHDSGNVISKNGRLYKIGKLLRMYYPDISDKAIGTIAGNLRLLVNPPELQIAAFKPVIEALYAKQQEPITSMNGIEVDGILAASVYAGPDTAIYYIEHVARAVVNNKNNSYCSILGDKYIMEQLLRKTGLHHNDNALLGARLLALYDTRDLLIMPYIEGANQGIKIDKDGFAVVTHDHDLEAIGLANGLHGHLMPTYTPTSYVCKTCGYDSSDYGYFVFGHKSGLMCHHCYWEKYHEHYDG